MNVLVTGGTGFVGSHVCKQLAAEGNKVVMFGRSASEAKFKDFFTPEEMENVTFVRGDVLDSFQLIHALQDNKCDAIVHEAFILLSNTEKNMPNGCEINIMGTINVFEAARICGIKRVVWASSNAAIGAAEGVIDHDTKHDPTTVYGHCKNFDEFLGNFYNERYGLETIGLRYVVVYGAEAVNSSVTWIGAFMAEPALGAKKVTAKFADDVPSLVYVDDAARATIAALKCEYKRPVYNVVGDIMSVPDMAEYAKQVFPGLEVELVHGQLYPSWEYDTTVEEEELGYKPTITVKDGLIKTANIVRERAGLPPIEA